MLFGSSTRDAFFFFLHIHKTGGTSFSHALRWGSGFAKRHWVDPVDADASSFTELPEHERAKIGVLQGHFVYGVHEHYPGPSTYVTMMRDPVARIVSSYYYTLKTFPETTLSDIGLEAFAQGNSVHKERNAQARRIAGVRKDDVDGVGDDELYERAVSNIEASFACVGLLERFDESLMLMRHLLNWRLYPFYLREKSSVQRPRGDEISADLRAAIRDANAIDERLYAFAEDRLESQIARADVDLRATTRRFRVANAWYQRIAPALARGYRTFSS